MPQAPIRAASARVGVRGEVPAADLPALLLPLRIETRFGGSGSAPELWVRIYPDQISVDTHDPRFTAAEVRSTQGYWSELWRTAPDDAEGARRAFEGLARRYGGPRAAFLVQSPALTPTNPGERPAVATPAPEPLAATPSFDPLPEELERPESWSRAPLAVGLPPRWTLVLQRAGAPDRVEHGAPIPAELAVGPDPEAPPAPTAEGIAVDEGMRWMVDFDRAVEVGMALRIALAPEDLKLGFDRVLAFGLRASTPADPGPRTIASLLEAHRFTDGFDLVPQGAATNNATEAAAAFSRMDAGYARAFAAAGQAPPATDRDGPLLERALGLSEGALAHAEHAAQPDQLSSRQMLTALWPGTGGYFLAQMVSEVVSGSGAEAARDWALEHLRPRGHLPSIRVGDTPYGILPTGALAALRRRHEENPVSRALADLVGRLWPYWEQGSAEVPRATRDGDPDAELVSILGMDASARDFRVRYALGDELTWYTLAWLDIGKGKEDLIAAPGSAALKLLGHEDWDPRLVHLLQAAHDRGVPFPTVDEAPVSDDHGLPEVTLPDGSTGNYVSWLARAPLDHIRDDANHFPGGTPPTALLYKVLRHCVLLQWGRLAFGLLIEAGAIDAAVLREAELVGFGARAAATHGEGAKAKPTVWQALDHPAPGEGKARRVSDQLAVELATGSHRVRPLHDITASLEHLAGLSTAELERLFTETLDTFSHRLDPWIAGLLHETIERRRGPSGTVDYHLGAFGWIEDLRADPLPPVVSGELRRRVERVDAKRRSRPGEAPPRAAHEPRVDNAGFVHAPSLDQAATAAILRSGYLAHREESDGKRLAIDLSSARVRRALELLAGIREGQPLAALLGYRFERGLRRLGREVLIQPLRDRFPLYANRLSPTGPAEAVAANNVVNGLDLHRTWRRGALFDGTPPLDPGQREDVETLLADLDDVLDAIGDLSISESVFQLVRANPTAAGGLLDAVSRGERPPDPEVVRTPRGGIDLTHRLVMLLSPGPSRAAAWGGGGNPRAVAEQRLDAWASNLLPDPGKVRAVAAFSEAGAERSEAVTLAQLRLAPLDAIELAAAADEPARSELEQRLLYRARQANPGGADFELRFARDPSFAADGLTFPEFLLLARALRELLAGARPLVPADLIETDRKAASEGGAIDTGELSARASQAIEALAEDRGALGGAATAEDLREALFRASLYGVDGAIPVEPVGGGAEVTAALAAQRDAVEPELAKRLREAEEADGAFDRTGASEAALRDHLVGLLRTVFGRDFTVLPTFTAPAGAELDAALGAVGLLDGDRDAVERWLAQLVPVRPGVWRYDAVRGLSRLTAGHRGERLQLAQLPHADGERWLGLPFDPAAPPDPGHRVSVVAEILPGFDPTAAQCGLMLDEWVERVPLPAQSTGVAFHYDQPSARAPQALLLAVPPEGVASWDDSALTAVLTDTLALARARGVDLESLPALGQLLPALYFPFNPGGETVSLDWLRIG